MLNFFKSSKSEQGVMEPPKEEVQVQYKVEAPYVVKNTTVEEIHKSFYSEVESLLEYSKQDLDNTTDKKELIDKAQRLRSLGFTQTKEVSESTKEERRLINVNMEKANRQELQAAIKYFSQSYPLYKFITEASVKKLCEKYGLVYGDVEKYIGTVPDKNLKEIEAFRIQEADTLYRNETRYSGMVSRPSISYGRKEEEPAPADAAALTKYFTRDTIVRSYKAPLEIVAPLKDFKLDRMTIENFKLEATPPDNDPIVLHPVLYGNKKYYLIVTAWGDEASDELVLNPIQN